MTTPFSHRFRFRVGASVALLASLAILHYGAAQGLPGFVSDLWDYRAKCEELAEDERRTADLDERFTVSLARAEYRSVLHDRMLAGQLSLRAAAAEYRAIVGADESFERALAAIAPGSDDTERVANYLLTALVKGRSLDSATQDRLAAEFRAEFGREPAFRTLSDPVTAPTVLARVRAS